MTDYFVVIVNSNGMPGPMYGPYDWDEAETTLIAALESGKTNYGVVDITQEIRDELASDGSVMLINGAGAYIVSAEKFEY